MDIESNLENIINHVVFPIRLPQKSSDFENDGGFGIFLELACDALYSLFEKCLRVTEIINLFENWKSLQSNKVIFKIYSHKNTNYVLNNSK